MRNRTLIQDFLRKSEGCGIYTKYPDISDRSRWEGLSDSLKKKLVQAGEEAMKEPWTQLLISDFMEFKKSGNRQYNPGGLQAARESAGSKGQGRK